MDRTSGLYYSDATGVRLFTNGPPGTRVEETWLNGVQEELLYIIETCGLVPDSSNTTQVYDSIASMIEDLIPSGTKMVFYQTFAPTGWTAVAVNDYFLRVVTSGGTGGSIGGSWDTLSHTHAKGTLRANIYDNGNRMSYDTDANGFTADRYYSGGSVGSASEAIGDSTTIAGSTAAGTSTHGSAQHQYADIIIATKD